MMRTGKRDEPQPAHHLSLHPDHLSDELLLEAMAQGAVWAMDVLYQRYSGLLYSFVYHMIPDHHVAQDLVQEAFVSIWRHAASFSAQAGAARSWLFSIVHHRTIDYLRMLRRHSVVQELTWEQVDLEEQAVTADDVWQDVWRSVQAEQVRIALTQLSSAYRQVIELGYFQGYTHREIAQQCQLPLGTVKSRMRRAHSLLKGILAGAVDTGKALEK